MLRIVAPASRRFKTPPWAGGLIAVELLDRDDRDDEEGGDEDGNLEPPLPAFRTLVHGV
jgi:hypothetical protein